ncbi:hypothetical protein [Bdellovibrio bacteriovorus]|uniref:hypothetical protein n=1 Tax=Bdellovibrio bacteriovorus TaxID=959 RepID=UPI003AA94CC4
MKNLFASLMVVFIFLFQPLMALAEFVAPETVDQAMQAGLVQALVHAALTGKWVVAIAIVAMMGTVVVRQYLIPMWNIGEKALPWVSIILATISSIAAKVYLGVDPQQAAVAILISGGLASQLWSMGGKVLVEILMKMLGKKLAQSPKKKLALG